MGKPISTREAAIRRQVQIDRLLAPVARAAVKSLAAMREKLAATLTLPNAESAIGAILAEGLLAPGVVEPITEAQVAAYLQGVWNVQSYAPAEARAPGISLALVDRVRDSLADRLAMSPSTVDSIRNAYSKEAVDSLGKSVRFLEERIRKVMLESAGLVNMRQAKRIIDRALADAGLGLERRYYIETIYRTDMQRAYNGGIWDASHEGLVGTLLWGYEYAALLDDRTRDSHAAFDGMRLPKEDPRWEAFFPPNGYNCRCTVIEVYETDLPIVEPKPGAAPDEGWAFNPGRI